MKLSRILAVPALAAAAAAGVIATHREAAHMVLKNRTATVYDLDESTEWAGGTSYIGVPYATDSATQYVNIYVPEAETPPPLLVLIHGGGFVAGDAENRQSQLMYRYYRDHGYACASINYRLAQEAPFPGGLEDCKAAIRFLRANARQYGYDASRIALWGESAGGYLAVMCAVTDDSEFSSVPFIGQEETEEVSAQVQVLVDYYGAVDKTKLQEDLKAMKVPEVLYNRVNAWADKETTQGFENVESFWLRKNVSEMTQEELDASDPYAFIEKHVNPDSDLAVWIVHGDCDLTVPCPQSDRLAARFNEILGEGKVRYHRVAGMGHASDPLYSDDLLKQLRIFLDGHIRKN